MDIKTHPAPHCLVCANLGTALYTNVSDKLFDAPGVWNISQCKNIRCGTVWLNPYPNTETIPRFYTNYHTHEDNLIQNKEITKGASLMDKIRNAYLYSNYNYGEPSGTNWLYNAISYIHPGWQDARASNHFYIPKVSNGMFLDIGCGSGGSLAAMRKRGWQTYGIDFDESAIAVAKKRELTCAVGGLLEQQFPSSHFDAILMSHVIEHLPNPKEIIAECYRILKPGGTLTMITPNAGSWSHRIFGKHWRGLETPRHLQLFTPLSLKELAHQASFTKIKAFSSPHGELFFVRESRKIALQGKASSKLEKKLLTSRLFEHACLFIFGWLNRIFPNKCGMTVVVCIK